MTFWIPSASLLAGPYSPAVGENGTEAVSKDSVEITAWASNWTELIYGEDVSATFKTPEKAMGAATGSTLDIVSLGRGGQITVTFDNPIQNSTGWDFAVFENAMNDTFLELAYVEVSSNGIIFTRFDNDSLSVNPIGSFGAVDPTNIDGLAGKHRVGYGTPFDLGKLIQSPKVLSGKTNLAAITHIRLVDIVGNGTYRDSDGDPIYDPYPTHSSAGFDLEAVAVRYENLGFVNTIPEAPLLNQPSNNSVGLELIPKLQIESFSDPDASDTHIMTYWQISSDASFDSSNLVFDLKGTKSLQSVDLPPFILGELTTYYWRASVFDQAGSSSPWSESYSFKTGTDDGTHYVEYDWNSDGYPDTAIKTIQVLDPEGREFFLGIKADASVDSVELISFDIDSETKNELKDWGEFNRGLLSMEITLIPGVENGRIIVHLHPDLLEKEFWYYYDPFKEGLVASDAIYHKNRTEVTLNLKNDSSGRADLDGLVNGRMVLIGGIISTQLSEDDDGGVGDKGGCFINTIDSKPNSKGLLILAALLILAGLLTISEGQLGKTDKK